MSRPPALIAALKAVAFVGKEAAVSETNTSAANPTGKNGVPALFSLANFG